MDFEFTKDQKAVLKLCRDFADAEIRPRIRELEQSNEFPQDIFRKMGKLGLFTLCVPRAAWGTSRGSLSYCLAMKEISRADSGISVAMGVTNMVAETIYKFGNFDQQGTYLPRFASGEFVAGAFALTENSAGSDPSAMRTTAERMEDGSYVLNGEKTFITSGNVADVIIIFARTDPAKGHSGITSFLIEPDFEGFSVGKHEEKLGLLSSFTVSIFFENCRVSEKQILGGLNNGFKLAMSALDSGRIGIASQAVGIAEAALQASIEYVRTHESEGKPMVKNQLIQFKLADMEKKLAAAELLAYRAAWLKDREADFTLAAATAKLFASEACGEIVSDAVQIHGLDGYTEKYLVEKYMRDAKITTIYEGTSQIQKIVIAKQLLESREY